MILSLIMVAAITLGGATMWTNTNFNAVATSSNNAITFGKLLLNSNGQTGQSVTLDTLFESSKVSGIFEGEEVTGKKVSIIVAGDYGVNISVFYAPVITQAPILPNNLCTNQIIPDAISTSQFTSVVISTSQTTPDTISTSEFTPSMTSTSQITPNTIGVNTIMPEAITISPTIPTAIGMSSSQVTNQNLAAFQNNVKMKFQFQVKKKDTNVTNAFEVQVSPTDASTWIPLTKVQAALNQAMIILNANDIHPGDEISLIASIKYNSTGFDSNLYQGAHVDGVFKLIATEK